MTPALIRCLLAISALSEVCPSVASKDVAQLLGLKQRDQLSILFVRKFSLAPDEATRAAILLISELKEESLSKLQALK